MKCNSCNAEWTTQSSTVIEKCPFCGHSLIQAIKPAEETTSKAALMEYLAAAIDAENAVYACEKVISTLEQQKSSIRHTIAPREPERENCTSYDVYDKKRKIKDRLDPFMLLSMPVFAIAFAVWCYRVDRYWGSAVGGFFAGMILWALVGGLLFSILEKSLLKSVDRKQASKDDARYSEAMARYHEQMDRYNQSVQLENAAIAELDKSISEVKARKEGILEVLKQIYARNLIHPNFHKMVAVTQIRDYLDMKICEQLEGPTGAYAEYMKDVRANRICESISQLEDTMKKGFSQLYAAQASILRAISATNASLSEMNTQLNSSLSNMQQSLLSAQRASADQMQSHLSQANQHLSNINRTLSNAAYNEYIALKETSASAYLRRIS